MLNKKIITLITFMTIIIICFVFFISTVLINNTANKNMDKKASADEEVVSIDKNVNGTKDYTETTNYTSKELEDGISYGDGTKIMTEQIAKNIEQKVRGMVSQFEFSKAEKYLTNTLEEYDIEKSPAFNKIKNLYYDLPSMVNFPYMLESGEIDLLKNIIWDLDDVENFFVSIMWLERAERQSFIYMNDSINPVFYGRIKILSKEKVDKENIQDDIKRRFENIDEVIKIEFDIEDNTLLAYIVKSNDKFNLFKIEEKEKGSTHYLTINEWNEFDNKLNNNNSQINEKFDNTMNENNSNIRDLEEGENSK